MTRVFLGGQKGRCWVMPESGEPFWADLDTGNNQKPSSMKLYDFKHNQEVKPVPQWVLVYDGLRVRNGL